jgi:predicted HTH transcriptional regulator
MADFSAVDLPQLISDGESEHVEFKTRLEDTSAARVLSAFANTSGGVMLVGIGDGGEILGLSTDEVKEVHRRLQAIASSMFRPEDFGLGATEIDGRWVAYVKVNPVPDYLRPVATSGGQVYVRMGSRIQIAPSGVSTLRKLDSSPRTVNLFVAMSFRSAEEPALEDYFRAIERAAGRTGLPISIRRMDFVEGDYEISQRVMDEIAAAEIVLADFTLNSANVYFEVGYARGKGRRVIQTARKDTPLEFDVKTWRTLFYKNATELEERLLPSIIEAYNSAS